MVGSTSRRPRPDSTSHSMDSAGVRIVGNVTRGDRRERAEPRRDATRDDTWRSTRERAEPRPELHRRTRPAHQRPPSGRRGADDAERAERGSDPRRGQARVRPCSECGRDHAQRVQTPTRDVCGHHEHNRITPTADVSTRQDLREGRAALRPYDHGPRAKAVPMQNQRLSEGPTRRAAAGAVRGARHLDRRRTPMQPLLDVDAGSYDAYVAPSSHVVRSTTGTRSLATGGPRHPLIRPALCRCSASRSPS